MYLIENVTQSLNQKGYIALIALIIISVVVLFIGVSVSFSGISELQMGFAGSQSAKALNFAEACVEESLEKLRTTWGGGAISLNFDDGLCTATIEVGGNVATITSLGQVGDYTREVQVEVSSNLQIDAWQESNN